MSVFPDSCGIQIISNSTKERYHTAADTPLHDVSPVKKWCRGESMSHQIGKIFRDTRSMVSFYTLKT